MNVATPIPPNTKELVSLEGFYKMTWIKCSIIDEDVDWFLKRIAELGAENIETLEDEL